jgi:ferrochelatase
VEVLYDIDIFFREFAEKQDLKLWRAPSLNDSRQLADALADLARHGLQRAGNDSAAGGAARR